MSHSLVIGKYTLSWIQSRMIALRAPSFEVRLWLFDVVASYGVWAQELESGFNLDKEQMDRGLPYQRV